MSGSYEYPLDGARTAWLTVRFETVLREVVAYAIVLSVDTGGRRETVRVYDSAHGFNEMHRYTLRGRKQPGELFHAGRHARGDRRVHGPVRDDDRGVASMSDLRERQHRSEAERAFMEAIELGMQERSPYPEGAVFIDAEQPEAGVAISRAATEGKPVVLCSEDGRRQVLYPSAPAAA